MYIPIYKRDTMEFFSIIGTIYLSSAVARIFSIFTVSYSKLLYLGLRSKKACFDNIALSEYVYIKDIRIKFKTNVDSQIGFVLNRYFIPLKNT